MYNIFILIPQYFFDLPNLYASDDSFLCLIFIGPEIQTNNHYCRMKWGELVTALTVRNSFSCGNLDKLRCTIQAKCFLGSQAGLIREKGH